MYKFKNTDSSTETLKSQMKDHSNQRPHLFLKPFRPLYFDIHEPLTEGNPS